MDAPADDILDESNLSGDDPTGTATTSSPESKRGHGLQKKHGWRGLSAFKAQASMQDKLLDKLLQQVIPDNDNNTTTTAPSGHIQGTPVPGGDAALPSTRPPFSAPTMLNNFNRFNARIGVVFKFQARVIRLLSWRRASHTLSLLVVYTLVCLDPYLLTVLPLVAVLVGVLIPAFMARHPIDERELAYSPHGPPRAPARTVKPANPLSKDFFKNMRDLQNSMEDFSRAHDQVVTGLVPKTNFSDEALSSALFVGLFAATLFMMIAAQLLPWRLIALCGGWGAVVSGHPAVAQRLRQTQATYGDKREVAGLKAQSFLDDFVHGDIILDLAPETREVEIFELQHLDSAGGGEWEPWVFSPSPYDPLSQARITGDRPQGTRFFEDVRAPEGWEWSEKKWALDLWSREWVEERIITGVEVETEGERWVYDMFNENEVAAAGVRDVAEAPLLAAGKRLPSWEEGEEGEGRRGEWRRRRWVRLVKRKSSATGVTG